MIDTSPALVLVAVVVVLVTAGVYLLLERSLTRVLIGVVLLGNAANLLILMAGGRAGAPPILGVADPSEFSDPLPQALVLTAIVITLGTVAFVLALAYRSWRLHGHDEVADDVEDRRIARLAARDQHAYRDTDVEDPAQTLEEAAAAARDEIARVEDEIARAQAAHEQTTRAEVATGEGAP